MPNDTSLTYGRLYRKLRELGFQEYSVQLDGRHGRVFEHEKIAGTLITLPERQPDEVVEPFHLQPVLMMLKSAELLPETNPLLT
jgi:hypothetical protein